MKKEFEITNYSGYELLVEAEYDCYTDPWYGEDIDGYRGGSRLFIDYLKIISINGNNIEKVKDNIIEQYYNIKIEDIEDQVFVQIEEVDCE